MDPSPSFGEMNVTWYLNHGYLVFHPSLVRHEAGRPLQSACAEMREVLSHLSQLPYVDMKHLGLQGHSYGGAEVNYIVSCVDTFAAAAPSAAVSDLVSAYAGVRRSAFYYYESGQGNMGATLWQEPQWYVRESAVFRADKVATPLLIMHTTNDPIVPIS